MLSPSRGARPGGSALLGHEEPPSLEAGRRLGPYEVVALIEAGGMGEVYRARDTRLGRDVVHAGLGENHRALGWLGKSLDASDPESMILPVDPRLDGLRGDPRYAGLLRRMGLPLK